ncbi:hypothetical protein WR25_12409 isoform D [Diploscapter pachys]|nr:hypothetical protein WR25_12409 isoform D [Diploscapter pachys]
MEAVRSNGVEAAAEKAGGKEPKKEVKQEIEESTEKEEETIISQKLNNSAVVTDKPKYHVFRLSALRKPGSLLPASRQVHYISKMRPLPMARVPGVSTPYSSIRPLAVPRAINRPTTSFATSGPVKSTLFNSATARVSIDRNKDGAETDIRFARRHYMAAANPNHNQPNLPNGQNSTNSLSHSPAVSSVPWKTSAYHSALLMEKYKVQKHPVPDYSKLQKAANLSQILTVQVPHADRPKSPPISAIPKTRIVKRRLDDPLMLDVAVQVFDEPEHAPGQRDLAALKKELEETEMKLDQAKEDLRIAREGASDVEMRHTEEYRLMTENIELKVDEERAKLALDRLTRCSQASKVWKEAFEEANTDHEELKKKLNETNKALEKMRRKAEKALNRKPAFPITEALVLDRTHRCRVMRQRMNNITQYIARNCDCEESSPEFRNAAVLLLTHLDSSKDSAFKMRLSTTQTRTFMKKHKLSISAIGRLR